MAGECHFFEELLSQNASHNKQTNITTTIVYRVTVKTNTILNNQKTAKILNRTKHVIPTMHPQTLPQQVLQWA